MNREVFIKSLKDMKLVAHRLGYKMTNYPENSIEVVKTIFASNKLLDACYGFEFDICFTKDHIPVVVHDKYIDDITDRYGMIKEYTIKELKKLTFGFRKSISNDKKLTYKIVTLDELLNFFEHNKKLLKDKIIKIETKDYIYTNKDNMNSKNLKTLADILNKYPSLNSNIIHLSFWPFNLSKLKKIQIKNKYLVTKNDFLCDFNCLVFLTKFMPYLDNISLRIKTNDLPVVSENNSKRVNKKIKFDTNWMKHSNALKEKNMKYAIKKYGMVNLYVLSNYDEIDEICNHMSLDFFKQNKDFIVITTDNPFYFKTSKKISNIMN